MPDNELVALEIEGEPVGNAVSQELLLKIVRLQTLCAQVGEQGEMPEYEEEKMIAEQTGLSIEDVMAKSLGVSSDSVLRIMMLKRLIVELVREAIPSESERLDVEYFVRLDKSLMRHSVVHEFCD